MANPVELIPLLVVVLILIAAGGADVDAIEIAADGERTLTEVEDAYVVGGGRVTVPADARVNGSVYVIGGTLDVAGSVDGDVRQLAGNVSVGDGATITGELELIAGDKKVADGATIGRRSDVAAGLTTQRSLADQLGFFVMQAVVLALAGAAIARRRPVLLANVGDSVAEHWVVSATVGLLAAATGIALVVFMAVTVILLPVSVAGVALGVAVVAYSYLVFGYLIGQRLPVDRPDLATAAGVVVFLLALELLGRIPLVGALVDLGVITIGMGAVLVTYFGLREFEPVELPS